mgnify:CR=1 FL=1
MDEKATLKATPKKERHTEFLAALSTYGNVTRAAEIAGLDRTALYNKRKGDAAFSRAWDEAEALGSAALEDEARRRAYEGWEEPVWHKGKECGSVRKFSDTLLIVLLKAHMPERYRENIKIDLNSRVAAMSLEEKIAEAQRMAVELGVSL